MTFIVEYPQNLISMKTTQPKKRGPPVGSKNKFKTSPFTKKYKEELRPNNPPLSKKSKYQRAPETDEEFLARFQRNLEVFETANQVKSWNRSPTSETLNLTYLFLGVIIGFSVCATVLTPLVINSI